MVDWIGTYEDHTIAFISKKHKDIARKAFITRLDSFASALAPGSFVAFGMSEKEFNKRKPQPPFRYDLAVVMELPFKATQRMAEGSNVTCVIPEGQRAVKIKFLEHAHATDDGDADDDQAKYCFQVDIHPVMITHLEGCVLVQPVTMRENGSDLAKTSLPLQEVERVITRPSHEAIMKTNLGRFSEYH